MKTKILFTAALAGVLALGLALAGCKSPKPTPEAGAWKFTQALRESVSDTVRDQGRKDQLLALISQMDAVEKEFNGDVAAFVASFRRLNAGYDTPRAAFDDLFKTYDAQRIAARDRFVAVHFQMTALATPDEWGKIGKVEKKIYNELLKPRAQQKEDAS